MPGLARDPHRRKLDVALSLWHDRDPTPGLAERERVLQQLRQAAPGLRARGLTHLRLFGSIARGEAGPRSDVDLLIEVDPDSHFSLFDLVDLQDDLRELLGQPPHFAFATKLRAWLREEIRAEAISIF